MEIIEQGNSEESRMEMGQSIRKSTAVKQVTGILECPTNYHLLQSLHSKGSQLSALISG